MRYQPTNPRSFDPLEPWVELSVARRFRADTDVRDEIVEIREVVERHERGELHYWGYGPILKVNKMPSERVRSTWLHPLNIDPAIRDELARRRALLEAHHGRRSALRTLPAAAAKKGDRVRILGDEITQPEQAGRELTIAKVSNGTPMIGCITWECAEEGEGCPGHLVDGASKVEILHLES